MRFCNIILIYFFSDIFCSFVCWYKKGELVLFNKKQTNFNILFDTTDYKGVVRAINNLTTDFEKVTGNKPGLVTTADNNVKVIIGTLGNSKLIESLIS